MMEGQWTLADSVYGVKTNERLKLHSVLSYSDYKLIVQMFTHYFIE